MAGVPASKRAGGMLQRHAFNHVAAGLVRRHGSQQFVTAVQNPDAGRTVSFVSGKGQKIAADVLNVNFLMNHRLTGVDQAQRTVCMRGGGNFLNRENRSQHVGNAGHSHQFRPRRQRPVKIFRVKAAVVVHGKEIQSTAGLVAHHLPGHQIGMVFGFGKQNFVTGL